MPELVIDDMQTGYIELIDYILKHGRRRAPRGMATLNVRGLTLVLTQPTHALTENIGRKASTRLAALEALQLVAGESWPGLMVKVAPNTEQFLRNGQFDGAYGPRLKDAIPGVLQRIKNDPDTRQAVANIYDAKRDLAPWLVDVPCNNMVMYEVEDGKLNAWTVVRSNDAWWGVAHDVFMFTILQRTIADLLWLKVGEYRHTAYSMHLYESALRHVADLHEPTKPAQVAPSLCPVSEPPSTWEQVQDYAHTLSHHGHGLPEHAWWAEQAATWLP